jgi:hypothetical protein
VLATAAADLLLVRRKTMWLRFLFHVSYAVTVIADITVLFFVWPAYKRTRQRAFLFLALAFAVGVFDTICDHTIGLIRMGHTDLIAYRTLRNVAHYGVIIFGAVGVILLTRLYLARLLRADATPNV